MLYRIWCSSKWYHSRSIWMGIFQPRIDWLTIFSLTILIDDFWLTILWLTILIDDFWLTILIDDFDWQFLIDDFPLTKVDSRTFTHDFSLTIFSWRFWLTIFDWRFLIDDFDWRFFEWLTIFDWRFWLTIFQLTILIDDFDWRFSIDDFDWRFWLTIFDWRFWLTIFDWRFWLTILIDDFQLTILIDDFDWRFLIDDFDWRFLIDDFWLTILIDDFGLTIFDWIFQPRKLNSVLLLTFFKRSTVEDQNCQNGWKLCMLYRIWCSSKWYHSRSIWMGIFQPRKLNSVFLLTFFKRLQLKIRTVKMVENYVCCTEFDALQNDTTDQFEWEFSNLELDWLTIFDWRFWLTIFDWRFLIDDFDWRFLIDDFDWRFWLTIFDWRFWTWRKLNSVFLTDDFFKRSQLKILNCQNGWKLCMLYRIWCSLIDHFRSIWMGIFWPRFLIDDFDWRFSIDDFDWRFWLTIFDWRFWLTIFDWRFLIDDFDWRFSIDDFDWRFWLTIFDWRFSHWRFFKRSSWRFLIEWLKIMYDFWFLTIFLRLIDDFWLTILIDDFWLTIFDFWLTIFDWRFWLTILIDDFWLTILIDDFWLTIFDWILIDLESWTQYFYSLFSFWSTVEDQNCQNGWKLCMLYRIWCSSKWYHSRSIWMGIFQPRKLNSVFLLTFFKRSQLKIRTVKMVENYVCCTEFDALQNDTTLDQFEWEFSNLESWTQYFYSLFSNDRSWRSELSKWLKIMYVVQNFMLFWMIPLSINLNGNFPT